MRKVLFLDRDGVINMDYGYVHTPQDFVFQEGVIDFCRFAQVQGYEIIVITNQSGIERGIFTEEDFRRTTAFMLEGFAKEDVQIADVFYCPRLDGTDRKPSPGMFLKAQSKWDIDMGKSVSIGDNERDLAAGEAAGVGTNLLYEGDFEVLKERL